MAAGGELKYEAAASIWTPPPFDLHQLITLERGEVLSYGNGCKLEPARQLIDGMAAVALKLRQYLPLCWRHPLECPNPSIRV
jgi:hypothetical protein